VVEGIRKEHRPNGNPQNILRVTLGVQQRQRTSPRAARNQPLTYAQVFTQALNIIHQILRGVVFKRVFCRRASTATLVKRDDTVLFGVK
jgi:hypothetical protein